MDNYEEITLEKMKKNISKAGNMFYQYRSCQRNASTIYDIENIRHGVVYARTPLLMNDPFDSNIGFSIEEIYDECIDLALDQLDDQLNGFSKNIISELIKSRLMGKTFGLIAVLNNLNKYISDKVSKAHVSPINYIRYISENANDLYKHCSSDIKKHFNKEAFILLASLLKDYKGLEIDEKIIVEALDADDLLNKLEDEIINARDNIYYPFINDFLSKTTVTCFSASGWDNQLMWSHYANCYSGICVEYDFSKMNNFIGFMYPVKYSPIRPTIKLADFGINKLHKDDNGQLQLGKVEPNVNKIFSYLLTKNKCWSYEYEWRIINIEGKPNTPLFIDAPFIKSITFGFNIDETCKRILLDICQDRNITCYQLVFNPADYNLSREELACDNYTFDANFEENYFNTLANHITSVCEKAKGDCDLMVDSIENKNFKPQLMIDTLTGLLDFLTDTFFMKLSFNRYCKHTKPTENEINENEEMWESFRQIDEAVINSDIAPKEIEKSLMNLRITNMITLNQFYKAKHLIADIIEMQDKYKNLMWFEQSILKKEDN